MKYLLLAFLVFLSACAAEPVTEPEATPEPNPEPEPVACCRALTAECLACTEGVSVDEYCENNPETVGCEPEVVCGDGVCVESEALPELTMVWDEELGVEPRPYDLLADTCEGSRCVRGSEIGAECFGNRLCGRGCNGECIVVAERQAGYCAEDC